MAGSTEGYPINDAISSEKSDRLETMMRVCRWRERNRYLVEQIIPVVEQHEHGTPATEICRRLGIAEATFYGVGNSMVAWS